MLLLLPTILYVLKPKLLQLFKNFFNWNSFIGGHYIICSNQRKYYNFFKKFQLDYFFGAIYYSTQMGVLSTPIFQKLL